jgi:hypothetical protein
MAVASLPSLSDWLPTPGNDERMINNKQQTTTTNNNKTNLVGVNHVVDTRAECVQLLYQHVVRRRRSGWRRGQIRRSRRINIETTFAYATKLEFKKTVKVDS